MIVENKSKKEGSWTETKTNKETNGMGVLITQSQTKQKTDPKTSQTRVSKQKLVSGET